MLIAALCVAPAAGAAAPHGSVNAGPSGSVLAVWSDPAAAANDGFGSAVAISGHVAVVGAGGGAISRAYIYVRGVSGWSGKPKVTLGDREGSAYDRFGASVAVSGKTAVVGSSGGSSGGASDDGVAYVYEKGASGWPATPTVTLDDPDATAGDAFGFSVAVSGTLVTVGSPGTNGNAGIEYTYVESDSVWPSTPSVISPNPAPAISDGYGSSVAGSGQTTVVAAAGSNQFPGMAFIGHTAPSGRPASIVRSLWDPSATAGDFFGNGVAVSGATVVVGADGQGNAPASHQAYIYTKGATGWPASPTVTLGDPGGYPGDNWAMSVAVSGTTMVAGDNVAGSAGGGEAYVYTSIDATWLTQPTAILSDPGDNLIDQFGQSVAASGQTALVGAPGTDIGAGAAYLFAA